MTRHTWRIATLTVAAGLLTLSACGGSDGGGGSSAGGGGGGADIATAKAVVDKASTTPTDIGLTQPLKARPETGKSIISITVPAPVNEVKNTGMKAAAELLGWNFSTIAAGNTSATAVAAFESAISKKPDAIVFTAYPASIFAKQIGEADAAGITVLSDSTADGDTKGVIANLDGSDQFREWGEMAGAYFVVDSKGKGNAALFTLKEYPIFQPFVEGFQSVTKKSCPACSVEVVNQQVSDLGAKLPANVVSFLQRKPKTNWVVFPSGDLAQGVAAAIKSAGIANVKIGGDGANPTNFENLKAGTEEAWVGFAGVVLGWREIDILARHFEGSSIDEAKTALLPAQFVTGKNADSVAKTPDGYYVGVSDYADQFAKLWKVN